MNVVPRHLFVDTNVLIYASRVAEPFSQAANNALEVDEDAGDELCISRQILRKYLASVTRPQITAAPMPAAEAVADARRLAEIYIVLEDGPAVTDKLYEPLLQAPVGGKQVHDANLAATMLVHASPVC